MDVPHSCHATKSKMMAPTLRAQVKTWNHGECTWVVGPMTATSCPTSPPDSDSSPNAGKTIVGSSVWTKSTCAVGGSGRSTGVGSTTTVAAMTGVINGSATEAAGSAGAGAQSDGAQGSTGTAAGSARCASGCTMTAGSGSLSGGG